MSIATVGQAKYEYQDLVCLEMVLRFLNSGVACFVEAAGGEDATLRLTPQSVEYTLELQVKGAKSKAAAIDLQVLAEYLAHFPARRATDFLLERLTRDPCRVVVLVCAQRAKDDCDAFTMLEDWQGEFHHDGAITLKATEQLLKALSTVACDGRPGSTQRLAREAAAAKFATSAPVADVRRSLERLIILDQWSEPKVRSFLEHRLRTQHGIPVDLVDYALKRLVRCLVLHKGLDVDVVPEIRRTLGEASSPSIAPRDYVPRGQETAWADELTQQRVLLLSGPPKSGKSDAARSVAARLQAVGFASWVTSSIDHAERVLLDERNASTVVVLDDPLGALHTDAATAVDRFHRLDQIVRSLRANRRLVVAQSQELLFLAAHAQRLADVSTGGHAWHDLGILSKEFLQRVWTSCAQVHQLPAPLTILVADGLASGHFSYAPGVLSHIAAYSDSLKSPTSAADVDQLAQQSAEQLGAALAHDAEALVVALAIGSSTAEALPERELAFILGAGGAANTPRGLLSSAIFGGEPKEPALPDYDSPPVLPDAAKTQLLKLERHRVVLRSASKSVVISHPFYRAAARTVVERSTKGQGDDVMAALRRGLFSLSPDASAAAARNLPWLHATVGRTLGIGNELVEEAENGLHSYFLTTRDLCYAFLVRLAHESPQVHGERLSAWVGSAVCGSVDRLAWHETTPFMPVGMSASALKFLRSYESPAEEEVAAAAAAMASGDALPDMRAAVELLRFYKHHADRPTLKVLSRFLAYDAGVIRAEAAAIWLDRERQNDDELLGRLGRDAHPLVAAKATRSALRAWSQCSAQRKRKVLALLAGFTERPETAAVVLDEALRLFADDSPSSSRPWDAYQDLIPAALRAFPVGFKLSADRLYVSARRALKHMPPGQAVSLVGAWLEWLERQLADNQLPDDYALGLWDGVAGAMNFPAPARLALVERLLTFESTGCALVFVADLVDEWDVLTTEERDRMLAALRSDRADVTWLQAAALARGWVPPEIQRALLGAEDALSWTPQRLAGHISDDLLQACVRLHCGSPQPLWYLGKHHGSDTWKAVVAHIARRPDHALFDACFSELVRQLDNSELDAAAADLATACAWHAFEILVDRKVGVTGVWHRNAVDTFLQAADAQTQAMMQAQMVARAPAIFDNLSEIAEWTAHEATRQALLNSFPSDERLLTTLWILRQASDSSPSLSEAMVLLELLRQSPPRLHGTYRAVQDALKAVGAGEPLIQEVDALRQAAVDAKYEAINAMRGVDKSVLSHWMGPA